jgi:hypothetical protein
VMRSINGAIRVRGYGLSIDRDPSLSSGWMGNRMDRMDG